MNNSIRSFFTMGYVTKIGSVALFAMFLLGLTGGVHAGKGKSDAYFADAKGRFDKADYRGAIIQAKNALQEDRNLASARVLLGQALQAVGDFATAEVTLTEALAAGGARVDIVVPLAQAMAAQGKQKLLLASTDLMPAGLPPKVQQPLMLIRAAANADLGDLPLALKTILEARTLDPQHPASWLAEVTIRLRQSQIKEASEAVEKAAALAPDSADAHYLRASILHVQGKTTQALANYDKALGIEPGHLGALIARAGLLLDLNRYADAARDLTSISKVAPAHPLGIYLRALVAERENRPQEAQKALRELAEQLDRIPIDYIRFKPQVLMLNGLAHFGLNEPEKAKQYFEIFQKTQSDSPIAKPLAQIYLKSLNYDQAITVLETYLKAKPADAQALALLGSAYMGKGQYARATVLMEQALQARDDPRFHAVMGLSMLGGGKTANAIKELEKAVVQDSGQIPAALTLITHYQRTGQGKKALALTETLVKRQPNHPGFLNTLGMVRGNSGDLAGAKQAFENAIRLDPKFVAPILNLARIEIRTNALDSAESRLKGVLNINAKNALALFEMSQIENLRGRPASAKSWLEQATAQSGPRETRYGLALSELHLRNGNAPAALETAKAMSAKATDELPVVLTLVKAQIATGDIPGAKSNLVAATRMADYSPPQQVQVAQLQMAINNPRGAAYSLEKALSSQADFLPALAMQAQVSLMEGDVEKALKRARELIGKYPKRATGYGLQGEIQLTKGQIPAALASFKQAHQVQPSTDTFLLVFRLLGLQGDRKLANDWASAWLNLHPKDLVAKQALGDFQARNGDYSNAKQTYLEILAQAPAQPDALNNLANALLALNDAAGAVKFASQAMANNNLSIAATDTLGWALLKNGQKEQALLTLRQAHKMAPDNPEIRFHLGAALAQSGLKNDAKTELEAALKSGTNAKWVAQAAALLKSLN